MTIEDVRNLEYVGDWYRPYSKSTYMKMTKEELIEHLAIAFNNWRSAELCIRRVSEYAGILQNKINRADVMARAYHAMTVKGETNGCLTINGLDTLQEAVDEYEGNIRLED